MALSQSRVLNKLVSDLVIPVGKLLCSLLYCNYLAQELASCQLEHHKIQKLRETLPGTKRELFKVLQSNHSLISVASGENSL